ncbi:hypothetical protein FA15DRAFT_716610 [Coprinopsis marcescibilis]|uniref:F-box domain-containing protein n=1 Tax=Coprinopsis marcescibilis TaxID=230819 RepID=A0A5C3L619_COPMA|nr:hypothetical protein FA15DRAFT_716610 [Coprinopsis marcescibilis]
MIVGAVIVVKESYESSAGSYSFHSSTTSHILRMSLLLEAVPNELILLIASNVRISAGDIGFGLGSFAMTCKRFHALLMPLMLEQHRRRLFGLESMDCLVLYDGAEEGGGTRTKLQDISRSSQGNIYGVELNHVRVNAALMRPRELWFVHGLLVRATKICGLSVGLHSNSQMLGQWSGLREEWVRAFIALLNACLVYPGLALTFEDITSQKKRKLA